MVLAAIVGSSEKIGAPYAPSLNRAFERIRTVFGRYPEVRVPLGGARTKAECDSQGTSWRISDHYEDRPARAVDIWNHSWFRSTSARAAIFDGILAAEGWRNVTTSGKPFPSEPWHYANRSTNPAGSGGTPLPGVPDPIVLEDDMPFLLYNPSSQHPDRRGWWAPGRPIDVLTSDQSVVGSALQKQLKRITSLTPDADVTTQVTDTMWAFIEWLEKNGDMPEIIDADAFAKEVAELLGPQLTIPVDVDEAAIAAALAPLLEHVGGLSEEDKAALAARAGEAARLAMANALSNG